ncbi:phosphate acetyl/butaryl transferase family protein [Mycobacterium ulcerans str. Harvey]|uniref:Phosphate acetyl/butaryl transferase family protein n=1 Tax=Mycobacterium ulcerans str. Harvey TaxID=1299332 RepID=A0ABN0QWK9_MYCUL|nr:phosphate acetyl/butaryl transferase family protein [Mycobacterium ulcerans str. Harvey]
MCNEFVDQYAQLRKAKGITHEQAREIMNDATYFDTMLVYNGMADGMVSGAAHTTAHTVRPRCRSSEPFRACPPSPASS